jgi:predicted PurR-regulated permease PerM
MADKPYDIPRSVLAVLFIVALIASSFWILRPFLGAIVWAGTIVIATWPLLLSWQAWLWNKRALAVAMMTLLLLAILIMPLTFAIGSIVANVDQIVVWAKSLASFKAPPPPAWLENLPFVGERAVELWNRVAGEGVEQLAVAAAPYAAGFVGWFVGQVGNVGILLVEFLLTVVLAATLYAKGERATQRLVRFGQRLAGAGGENAVWLAGQTIRSVALGVVVTALAQTALAGAGLALAGVPFAGILTVVMFLLCIAQIGVVLVLAAAVAWLYWTGQSTAGTFMLIWTIIVGGLDNFLRPILIRRGADLPLLLVFAGVIGGLLSMGLIGIFVGPVVLAVADKLLNAWIDGGITQASDQPQEPNADASMEDRAEMS